MFMGNVGVPLYSFLVWKTKGMPQLVFGSGLFFGSVDKEYNGQCTDRVL